MKHQIKAKETKKLRAKERKENKRSRKDKRVVQESV